nr:DUF4192 family protein [Nocardia carnea]
MHEPHDMADTVATAAAANSADAVLVSIIDDRQPPLHPYHAVLIAVHDRLTESDTEVKGAWTVPRIAPGQRWHSLRPSHQGGTLPDPATTVTAVDRVYQGGSVAPDRSTPRRPVHLAARTGKAGRRCWPSIDQRWATVGSAISAPHHLPVTSSGNPRTTAQLAAVSC